MFIDIDSLKIKVPGGNYINLGYYVDNDNNEHSLITQARYSYNKVWADDSGRNLSGSMTGTLIGIFPKIIVSFKRLTKSELELIAPILDAPRQVLRYYDPNKKAYVEMTTYTGDYEISNTKIIDENKKTDNFDISFIAIDRRS